MGKKINRNRIKAAFHPTGEVFHHDGAQVLAVKEDGMYCEACYFLDKNCNEVQCLDSEREDGIDVHFEEVL